MYQQYKIVFKTYSTYKNKFYKTFDWLSSQLIITKIKLTTILLKDTTLCPKSDDELLMINRTHPFPVGILKL